jgi:deoxyribose-phosphate aldolase
MSETQPTKEEFAKMIDHTNLSPYAKPKDIENTCQEAIDCGFGQVCVRPDMVKIASNYLQGKGIGIVSVVGFPRNVHPLCDDMIAELSPYTTDVKVQEALNAIQDGATEIDMIIDLNALKTGNHTIARSDITAVVKAIGNRPLKVILETGYLQEREIISGCIAAENAGASYVKTSTGFGLRGADLNDIRIMSENTRSTMGIKASGGIRTLQDVANLYDEAQKAKPHLKFRIGASKLVYEFKPGDANAPKPGSY